IGRGHKIAFNVLNIGRLKLGARSVGAMKLSLSESAKYAKERHQFGQPIASFPLIKQKIAGMGIRAYVGESMLYRALGAIDRSLESTDKDDHHKVLAVLEQYAAECSIIKVWETEALAWIVDEEVQVFGGYGYSRDYPAERAYRDARIARIYEGTNEINRIVIATQLLRRARSGELALLDAADRVGAGGAAVNDTLSLNLAATTLSHELKMLAAAKAMAVTSIGAVMRAYGDRARDEQEALALIADIVIDVYAMESCLLRTERLIAERGEERASVQTDITRVFVRDAAERVERAARSIAVETSDGNESGLVDRLVHRAPMKSVAAVRRIADSFLTAGKYNL
ncbi:MAG TPA: acyl-CoA dehydrogenase family protein, partial [Blastocatellia bacterium]|nr:acyl-CoA dehydrogenase family protein [Blastocatellia bacterium]